MPSNSVARMFLPPLETPLARFLVTTFASISWVLASRRDESCKLAQGYDDNKQLEYIEIKCDSFNIDRHIMAMWNMRGESLTRIAWEDVKLLYNENEQKIVFDAGGFPGRYRQLQDILFTKYTRYFFARGFAMEAYKEEVYTKKGGKPKPKRGFIDFSLRNSIPFLYGLNQLRQKLKIAYENRAINILLGDLGDRDLGLKEAILTLYSPVIEKNGEGNPKVSVSKPTDRLGIKLPPLKLGADIATLIVYSLQLKIVSYILQGSIELVSRWPTISIAIYKAGRGVRGDDTRTLNILAIDSEEVFATLEGIGASAEDIGVEPLRLVDGSISILDCAYGLARRGEQDAITVAGVLVSRSIPLIDSLIRGFVDRDLHYQVIRTLESISRSRDAPWPCTRALHNLA